MRMYSAYFFVCVIALVSAEFKRVCIYPNWAALRASETARLFPRDIDPFLCTHIHFAYANIDVRTLQLIPSQDEDTTTGFHGEPLYKQVMQLKEANPNLKVLISIGGWLVKSTPFNRILNDKQALKTFIDHVIGFMEEWKFDGLDIQWEYPGAIEFGATADSKTRYMLLIKHLHESFQSKYLLTTFVPADESHIDSGYQVDFICFYLDYVSVETYDFSNNLRAKHNSPLYSVSNETSVEKSILHWTKRGCPKNKLLVGLPTYSRGLLIEKNKSTEPLGSNGTIFTQASEYTDENGILSYYEVCKKISKGNTNKYWDKTAKIAHLVTNHDDRNNLWISYENSQSAKDKADFVKKNLLGGISIWSIDLDDFSGAFCSQGKYPIAQAVKDALDIPKSKITNKIVLEQNNEWSILTTKITKYFYISEPTIEVKQERIQRMFSTKKQFENLRVDFTFKLGTQRPFTESNSNKLEDKPVSYFQSLYKKYKSMRGLQSSYNLQLNCSNELNGKFFYLHFLSLTIFLLLLK